MANEITWSKVKLGDICDIKRGKRLTKKQLSEEKTSEFKFRVIHGGIKPLGYYNEANRAGDVTIVINTGNAGDVHYIDEDFWSSDACYCLYAKNGIALNKFIYYQVLTHEAYLHSQVRKSAMPTISAEPIEKLEIYIPSIEEQKRIVDLLSHFDELIQINEFKANNLIKAKTQLMNDIFSGGLRSLPDINPEDFVQSNWVKVKLGDIASIASGKGIKKSEYLETGTYPIIGANGEIGRCNQKNTTHKVITTGRVGTIGTVHRVNDAWITDNTLIIDLIDSAVDFDYLYYSLGTIDFKSITTGNAQPLVTAGRLKDIEIAVPPTLQEQKQIASLLSSYDELIQLNRDKLSTVNKMKTQLMNQIFAERERVG